MAGDEQVMAYIGTPDIERGVVGDAAILIALTVAMVFFTVRDAIH